MCHALSGMTGIVATANISGMRSSVNHHRILPAMLFLALLSVGSSALALENVLQDPQEFIQEAFAGDVPKPDVIWLTQDLAAAAADIMGHRLNVLRIRYWQRDRRSAWILEEIGKERPITTGIVIANGEIERIKVLIYRESRGHEVQYAFFTEQFRGATLETDRQLDRPIDGISGATLSVRALTKLARLALYLDHHVQQKAGS